MFDVLTATGVLIGLCAFLALLLVIAGRTLKSGGPTRLTVNDDPPRLVDGGDPLLGVLKEQGIFIPSACGGRGSCGMCKVVVASGGGPLLPTETPHLTPEEREQGVRLSCQLKLREDMAIRIPPELLEVEEYTATVAAIEEATYDIRRLRLALAPDSGFSFQAGQYIQLEAPMYDGLAEPTYRAYSLSSSPHAPGELEVLIRKVPRGICTTFVHELLVAGDSVTLNGPYGEFTLRDTPAEAVFIAGGSGMAPFESILADMAERKVARKVTYFFGAVSRRDLYDLDRMAEFENTVPGFRFVPALSKPAEGDAWQGETGLITDVVARHYDSMAHMEAYLCGSPGMIDACIQVLTDKGLKSENIFYDKF